MSDIINNRTPEEQELEEAVFAWYDACWEPTARSGWHPTYAAVADKVEALRGSRKPKPRFSVERADADNYSVTDGLYGLCASNLSKYWAEVIASALNDYIASDRLNQNRDKV